MRKLKIFFALLVLFISMPSFLLGIDLEAFNKETVRTKQTTSDVTYVWWILPQFWEHVMTEDGRTPKAVIDEFIDILEQYSIFAVVQADVGTKGLISKSNHEVLLNSKLVVKGETIPPVPENEVDENVQVMLIRMKPAFRQIFGDIGKAMTFIVFPNTESKIDPLKKGNFTFMVYKESFDWNLPLSSLLPPKFDSKSGESFPGDFLYNPYTGDLLVDESKVQQAAGGDRPR